MPQGTVSQYRIIEYLGGGSMGKVYLAEDTLLRRKVALKFLPPELTDDENSSRRFMTEARATSSLDHDNICSVLQISQTETDEWFIAMRYYEGATLKKVTGGEPLDPLRALTFALKIARGLSAAHEHNIVHRDIKPANVIVTTDDNIKILDFGLARLVNRSRQTRSGTVMGTAAYMSPEQARGEDVGPGADIWALGVVLYEMLSGKLPFRGETEIAMIFSILNQDPDPLEVKEFKAGKNCARILERCLEKDPERRYTSAKVLADDLAHVIEEENRTGKTKTHRRPLSVKPRRRRWAVPALALTLAIALAGFLVPGGWEGVQAFLPGGKQPASIAVLPFELTGENESAAALGFGLGMTLTDRLSELEGDGARLWVIPPEDIRSGLVGDRELAVRRLAADYVVTGEGTFDGQTIAIEVRLYDRSTGSEKTREFRDSFGNLETWQRGLVSWLAHQVDPDLALDLPRPDGVGCTAVPIAFLSFSRGRGRMALAESNPDDRTYYLSQAQADFSTAIAADSSFACAWAGLGSSEARLAGQGGEPLAIENLEQAVRLSPELVGAQIGLAEVYFDHGDSALSMKYAERAHEIQPDHLPAIYALGSMNSQYGNTREAARYYELATDRRPDYPMAYMKAGMYHYHRREMDQAIRYWERMVELTPDDYFGRNLLGAALFAQERWTEAGEQFQASLAIETSSSAYANLGTISYYDGRYLDAIDLFHRSITEHLIDYPDRPFNYKLFQDMAEAFRWAPGHEDSAQVYYGQALVLLESELDHDPDNPELLVDKASFAANLGQPEEARDILTDLAKRPGLSPEHMFTMATVFEEIDDREKALHWLEKSLAAGQSPRMVEVYPILRNLRASSRYQEMIRNLNTP